MSRNRRRTSATLFPYTTLFRSRHEVRGGVHPHPEAARGELGGRESAGRALAVGARDVDGGEMPLGMAQHVERSEEHTSELQSHSDLVCRLLLEKKKRE